MDNQKVRSLSDDWQINKESIWQRGKYLLENAIWTDCKFIVGTDEPYRVSAHS